MGKKFWKAAGIRALRTVCQVAVANIATNGIGVTDVDWVGVASVATLAGIVSLLNSIATGLPEADETPEHFEYGGE